VNVVRLVHRCAHIEGDCSDGGGAEVRSALDIVAWMFPNAIFGDPPTILMRRAQQLARSPRCAPSTPLEPSAPGRTPTTTRCRSRHRPPPTAPCACRAAAVRVGREEPSAACATLEDDCWPPLEVPCPCDHPWPGSLGCELCRPMPGELW